MNNFQPNSTPDHAPEETPAERLRQARKAAGYKTAANAALALAVNPTTYTAHENGGRKLNADNAEKYAPHFGVKPEWLLYGSQNVGKTEPEYEIESSGSPPSEERALSIPGTGNLSFDDIEEDFDLPDQFLRSRLRIKDDGARVMEVIGDYMYDPANPSAAGSLMPGDRVIIDLGDRRPSPPGAFAVFDGAGVSLKLIEVVPNSEPLKLRVTGRNPRYAHFEQLHDSISIIGRVKAKVSML